MSTLSQIESEIASLPGDLRAEVLDFVRFVKQRDGIVSAPVSATQAIDPGDSPLFEALRDAGFVACIDTQDQLSRIYKSQLDFSNKLETSP